MNPRLAATAALLALAATACSHIAAPAAAPAPQPDRPMLLVSFEPLELSAAIFAETNRVRGAFRLPTLAPSQILDAAAGEQAAYMALDSQAAHDNPFPGEHDVAERVAKEGLDTGRVGENVIMMSALRPDGAPPRGYTYAEYAALLVDAWMNSPPHRANILNPSFTYLGCAAQLGKGVRNGNDEIYADQVFLLARPVQGGLGSRGP